MELKIEQLQKKYGENTVLNIPELTIHSGELVGLVGNNGAGKTTLLRLMLDVIEATQGRVLSGDQNVATSEVWKTYTGSFIDKHFLTRLRSISPLSPRFTTLPKRRCNNVWKNMPR